MSEVKEVSVWNREKVVQAIMFKAAHCKGENSNMLLRLAEKIKRGDILIVHNPERTQ